MSELSNKIVVLRSEGKTYSQIQQELGCSKGTIAYHLGLGQKEKSAARQKDRRRTISSYIQAVKQTTPCADCGENYPYWIMEFDHLGDKLFQLSNHHHKGYSLEDVQAEIAKCDVVCSNCHKNRTFLRLVKTAEYVPDLSEWYT